MSWMTGRFAFRMRGYARALGVPKLVARFRPGYEEAYARRLKAAIRSADVVWDVGANVGHYTTLISQWVGPGGKVFAFEPDRVTQLRLRESCGTLGNVSLQNYGLSQRTARAKLVAGSDSLRATSRLVASDSTEAGALDADLRAGDEAIAKGLADPPNVVKIDVEGHELDVLRGLQTTLRDGRLRSVLVEVHFGLLDRAGRAGDARQIEDLLETHQFRIEWVDASHLFAQRTGMA